MTCFTGQFANGIALELTGNEARAADAVMVGGKNCRSFELDRVVFQVDVRYQQRQRNAFKVWDSFQCNGNLLTNLGG